MKKNNKGLLALAGIVGYGVYSYVKGNGIFNDFRFKKEHEIASRYIDGHYKNAVYSPIKQVGDGFITVITTNSGAKIVLTFTKTNDNNYIFSEKIM